MADKNKVRFGLSGVHVAFFATTSAAGAPVWDTPIAIPGAVNMTRDSSNEEYVFYADNIAYYSTFSAGNDTIELEMALFPDAVIARIQGYTIDALGGVLETSGGKKESFAFMGQVEGDVAGRRFVYYNCAGGKPTTENKTVEESVEVATETMPITASTLVLGNGKTAPKYTLPLDESIPENKTVYDGFFDAVYVPPAA